MATNQELIELMELDLGINIINRKPYAKEIFNWLDIDLLPHSSEDTLLCEIYEWNGRNWRTTEKNLAGYLFEGNELNRIIHELKNTPIYFANVPDFEFTKDHIIDLGLKIPALFNIGFTGNLNNAKEVSVKVNSVVKSRITNVTPPGIELQKAYSTFTQKKSKAYRKNIKFNYLTNALFYAESVEINLEKSTGVDIGVDFDTSGIDVEAKIDTQNHKKYILKYKNKYAPFGASFVKGKDFAF